MPSPLPLRWPVLQSYAGAARARVAMPVGGIGTGTVSLGGNGAWRDWEIMNRPAKGFVPWAQGVWPGFVLRLQDSSGRVFLRALEGPLADASAEGPQGATAPNHGLPRFRHCRFDAAYPLGQVHLRDPDVPARITLQAFNPLIPGNADDSGLPVALVRVRLHNPGPRRLIASVCANLPNFIGKDGSRLRRSAWSGQMEPHGEKQNRNEFRARDNLHGLALSSAGVDPADAAWGTMALATDATRGVSYRTGWAERPWGNALLAFWRDFAADGALTNEASSADAPVGSLCVRLEVPPRSTRDVNFILAWHFPNRRAWATSDPDDGRPLVGNHYATRCRDAWAVAALVARRREELERATVDFVRAFVASDFPRPAKDAALSNLSTLRSQTCFRLPDGRLYGWEGCHERQGSCWGNCTHVWNYEQATPFLFGALARSMRELEFGPAMDDDGCMGFRLNLPLDGPRFPTAAADGQMGCLVKLYREWQLGGDREFLRQLWPRARRALEFCWIAGGWDADADGVMEGCQHNTMDVEYFGPNPQMASWYLGALRASAAMAAALGDDAFAERCRQLGSRGQRWIDRHLFNGDFYEQRVASLAANRIDPRLRSEMGARDPAHPTLQVGAGCLIDQLAGQPTAYLAGLGPLLDPANMRRALASVVRFNRRPDYWDHFNSFRSFTTGGEAGLTMCSYPRQPAPAEPFPYSYETMSGFEYNVAIQLIWEGRATEGLKIVQAVRARHDGRRRNPFNEAECGFHYVRAMAAWGLVPALSGFAYSGVTGELRFARPRGAARWFWSNGSAWGTVRLRRANPRTFAMTLHCHHGALRLGRVGLTGWGEHALPKIRTLAAGHAWTVKIPRRSSRPIQSLE